VTFLWARLSKIEHFFLPARRLFSFERVLDRVFDAADESKGKADKLEGKVQNAKHVS